MSTQGKPMTVIPLHKRNTALRDLNTKISRKRETIRRDLAAKRKDRSRASLADDVQIFLAKGGEIQELPGYTDGPIVTPARIHGRGLY